MPSPSVDPHQSLLKSPTPAAPPNAPSEKWLQPAPAAPPTHSTASAGLHSPSCPTSRPPYRSASHGNSSRWHQLATLARSTAGSHRHAAPSKPNAKPSVPLRSAPPDRHHGRAGTRLPPHAHIRSHTVAPTPPPSDPAARLPKKTSEHRRAAPLPPRSPNREAHPDPRETSPPR